MEGVFDLELDDDGIVMDIDTMSDLKAARGIVAGRC
jgi:hypothetical protein